MWFEELLRGLASGYGYPGVLLMSLIACLSIVFPIPYTPILFALSAPNFKFDPFLLAVFASIGSVFGELTGYFLGYFGREAASETTKKRLDALLKIFKRYGLVAIFIFALTPLPDDLLFIPIGVLHYPLLKVLVACALGKFLMHLIITYSGRYAFTWILQVYGAEVGWVSTVVLTILLFLIALAMFRINWEKFLEKLEGKAQGKSSH